MSNVLDPPKNYSVGDVKNRSKILSIIFGIFFPTAIYLYLGKRKRAIIAGFVLLAISIVNIIVFQIFFSFAIYLLTGLALLITHIIFLINIIIVAVHEGKGYVLKSYNRWYSYILILVAFGIPYQVISLITEGLLSEIVTMQSATMEPTIYENEGVMVNLLAYGVNSRIRDGYDIKFREPERYDIVKFTVYESVSGMIEKKELVSRCVGLPGDLVYIQNNILYVNDQIEPNLEEKEILESELENGKEELGIFPNNQGWNSSYYGPFLVPGKGRYIIVTEKTIDTWGKFILIDNNIDPTEGFNKEDVYKEYVKDSQYLVKRDYCFMLSDSRTSSKDSRHFGLIPIDDVLGKAEFIVLPEVDGSGKMRFGKKLE